MKTYMTDRTKTNDDGSWYTPYQQDQDDIRRRKANKMSKTAVLGWILIWFILLAVFW